MSDVDSRQIGGASELREKPRAQGGQFLPVATADKRLAKRKRTPRETDYLRSVVGAVKQDDVRKVVLAIVQDAVGDGVDVKKVNAAREWLGKYILGGGRVQLQDVDCPPVIVKTR